VFCFYYGGPKQDVTAGTIFGFSGSAKLAFGRYAAGRSAARASRLVLQRPWTRASNHCHVDDAEVRRAMATNPVWEICERMAEVQALLHDHVECDKHSAADVVAKAQAVLSESELLRAMFDVGYFPPNTPPPAN
jgi:hypothetical protein